MKRDPPAWIGARQHQAPRAAPWARQGPVSSRPTPSARPMPSVRPASRRPGQGGPLPSRVPPVIQVHTTSPPTIRSMPPRAASAPPSADLIAARVTVASLEHALAAARTEADALRAELDRMGVEDASQTEETLLGLALAIARRVVGRELATDPALVVEWVREALADPRLADASIAVAADVAAAVSPGSWGDLAPRVEVDPHLPPGGAEVRGTLHSAATSADARLDLVAEHVGAKE